MKPVSAGTASLLSATDIPDVAAGAAEVVLPAKTYAKISVLVGALVTYIETEFKRCKAE
jgi:hypothetical protein